LSKTFGKGETKLVLEGMNYGGCPSCEVCPRRLSWYSIL